MDNHSQHEANKVLRVLQGKPLKYTVRVHMPDDRVVEFQSDSAPKIKFFEEDRCLWLFIGQYDNTPVMRWPEGGIILTEENPK